MVRIFLMPRPSELQPMLTIINFMDFPFIVQFMSTSAVTIHRHPR